MNGTVRRALGLLVGAGLLLAIAPPAAAAPKKVSANFTYGKDISSWYWARQIDQEVTTPVPIGDLHPSQRVRFGHPHNEDVLPVAMVNGEHERMSAVKFDLVDRGVTPGSKIRKLTLRIQESDEPRDAAVQPEEGKIRACRIIEVLVSGENERFEDQPDFSQSACVNGSRRTPRNENAFWQFDLTRIARAWGSNPFDNQGVMLVGVPEEGATWQVPLRLPSRDDPDSPENEYRQTRGRAVMNLQFVPGAPLLPPPPPAISPGGGGSFDAGPAVSGGSASPGGFAPSTDLSGGDVGTSPVVGGPVTETPQEEPAQAAPVAQTQPQLPAPRLPGYVWAVIPLALLGLAAVRSVVMEPVGGPRPDGVIQAIRRRNAERRGGAIREVRDPMAQIGSAARGALAGAARGISRGISTITRSVRRR